MYFLYTIILLTLLFPKNLDLSQFNISKGMPENFKHKSIDSNTNTRDEILFTYDFEDGEDFTDVNGNGQWDFGEPYIDENGNFSYDSGGGWLEFGNWVAEDAQFYSPSHSYNSPHAFNTNGSINSPKIQLPEIIDDGTESLRFRYMILNNQFDADGNEDGFLEDFYNVWLRDLDAESFWTSTPFSPFSDGNAYWCADPQVGGYGNNTNDFLDTPSLLIGENAEFQAKIQYSIEDFADASWDGTCADGWDVANVRISADGGETWELLVDENNPYDFDCGFGFVQHDFDYNTGGPLNHLAGGWGGQSPGWFNFNANLSEYSGQEIIIRFAFGADFAQSYADDNTLTGLQVDDIIIVDDEGITYIDDLDGSDDSGSMISYGDQWIFLYWDWKGTDPFFGNPRPGSNGEWELFDGSAFFGPDISGNLSAYQNHEIQIQINTFYDGDMNGGAGTGLFIDDFQIYKDVEIPLVGQTLTEEQLNTEFEICYGNDDYNVGDTFKLSDYDGSSNSSGNHYVTLLNIDASWCPPCFDNLVDIANVAEYYANERGVLIAEGLFDFNTFGGTNDPNQTTCQAWGDEMANYTDNVPFVFDDSNYTAFGWWQTEYSIPSFIIIDHTSEIRYSGNNLTYWSTINSMDLLLEECGDLCNNFIQGDLNQDDIVNIIDIILVIDYILDDTYNESADLNDDGTNNILDILILVDIIIANEN